LVELSANKNLTSDARHMAGGSMNEE
jgi:hypothetical protein